MAVRPNPGTQPMTTGAEKPNSVEVLPFGLPMSDADLDLHYGASKNDIVDLVGSEVRQLIGEIRYHRARITSSQATPSGEVVEAAQFLAANLKNARGNITA